jgi:hypothetical protein
MLPDCSTYQGQICIYLKGGVENFWWGASGTTQWASAKPFTQNRRGLGARIGILGGFNLPPPPVNLPMLHTCWKWGDCNVNNNCDSSWGRSSPAGKNGINRFLISGLPNSGARVSGVITRFRSTAIEKYVGLKLAKMTSPVWTRCVYMHETVFLL